MNRRGWTTTGGGRECAVCPWPYWCARPSATRSANVKAGPLRASQGVSSPLPWASGAHHHRAAETEACGRGAPRQIRKAPLFGQGGPGTLQTVGLIGRRTRLAVISTAGGRRRLDRARFGRWCCVCGPNVTGQIPVGGLPCSSDGAGDARSLPPSPTRCAVRRNSTIAVFAARPSCGRCLVVQHCTGILGPMPGGSAWSSLPEPMQRARSGRFGSWVAAFP